MTELIEAVPNISVGKDRVILDQIVTDMSQAAELQRVNFADLHVDDDHDRSVFTFIGSSTGIIEVIRALYESTTRHTSLANYSGVHPHIGMVDVVPIVPLAGVEKRDAFVAAQSVAKTIGEFVSHDFQIPVIRYGLTEQGSVKGAASTTQVRRGGIDQIAGLIEAGEFELFGTTTDPHPQFGASMIGVRDILVALNVDLVTDDVRVATRIAANIRESRGSDLELIGVRVLGLLMRRRELVAAQISTNIDQYATCGPYELVERIVRELAPNEGAIRRIELVGLAPQQSLDAIHRACRDFGTEFVGNDESLEHAASSTA